METQLPQIKQMTTVARSFQCCESCCCCCKHIHPLYDLMSYCHLVVKLQKVTVVGNKRDWYISLGFSTLLYEYIHLNQFIRKTPWILCESNLFPVSLHNKATLHFTLKQPIWRHYIGSEKFRWIMITIFFWNFID